MIQDTQRDYVSAPEWHNMIERMIHSSVSIRQSADLVPPPPQIQRRNKQAFHFCLLIIQIKQN